MREQKVSKKSSSSWRQKSLYEKNKNRNTGKEEKGVWWFGNTKKDFFLRAGKEKSWVICIILKGSNLIQLQNNKLLLSTLTAASQVQVTEPCPEASPPNWKVSCGCWTIFIFFTCICTGALSQSGAHEPLYLSKRERQEKLLIFFGIYITFQSMPVCLYPDTEYECQAHLKMTMLQGQVQPGAIQPGMQWEWDFGASSCMVKPKGRRKTPPNTVSWRPRLQCAAGELFLSRCLVWVLSRCKKSNWCQLLTSTLQRPLCCFLTSLIHKSRDSSAAWVISRKNKESLL